jgi:3-oxoacyl-[acyl-carrier protein] reductase
MNHTSKLTGKRAVVTAGAQGIGLAISRALLAQGCDVFVHYHSSSAGAEELATVATSQGRTFGAIAADLTQPDGGEVVIEAAVARLGGVDILVNNAGSLVARHNLDTIDDAFWAKVMALNVDSLWRVSQAAQPLLIKAAANRGGASIINLASLAGRKGGHAGSLAYSTAKGAVLTFTRSLASELGSRGVRVNALAPGLILGTSFHHTHTTDASAQATIAGIPLGRAGNPDDVARAVLFFASEFDGFITGATLDVNGGVWAA